MVTITCTITFSDGATLIAKCSSPSPEGCSDPVTYSGSLVTPIKSPRIANYYLPETSSVPHIRAIFTGLAASANATLDISQTGLYDTWAE